MIIQKMHEALSKAPADNALFNRTLLKNILQDYVLRFVYESVSYKNLIFTGGTALRKIYGLPRFSEDLDFDSPKAVNADLFALNAQKFFREKLGYREMTTKISGNKKTVFLKFPVLEELGLKKNPAETPWLFLRCDFAREQTNLQTEIVSLAVSDYVFFVKTYDLPVLFANKIIAFLERVYFKGREQKIAFKGRDIFDIVWLIDLSAKNGFKIKPDAARLNKRLKTDSPRQVFAAIIKKMGKINKSDVKNDLLPFLENPDAAANFADNFLESVRNKGQYVFD